MWEVLSLFSGVYRKNMAETIPFFEESVICFVAFFKYTLQKPK